MGVNWTFGKHFCYASEMNLIKCVYIPVKGAHLKKKKKSFYVF